VANKRPELEVALLRASPDAVIVVDGTGHIEMANPAVESLFGWPPDELVGQPVELLIPEDLRDLHRRHRATYTTRPATRAMGSGLDLRGRRRDGTSFPVDVGLAPLAVDGYTWIGAFVRDATDRRRGEDLLRFVNEISRALLAGQPTAETLRLTAGRARALVEADAAWVVVPRDGAQLAVAAADGNGAEVLLGAEVSATHSLSSRVMREGRPLVVADMARDPAVIAGVRHLGLGPGLYLPMAADSGAMGTLVVARGAGCPTFEPAETQVLEVFSAAAAIVLSLGQARAELETLRLVSEHERIARDLHDTVIQRLFALGMSLQALQGLTEGIVRERVAEAVVTIDDVIREIRETIFDLAQPEAGAAGIRRRVREVVGEAAQQLGFAPRVAFRGPVEAAIDDRLLPDIVSVVREALSNVGRHARASAAEVVLDARNGSIVLSVADNGVGFGGGPSAGHGLANLEARATKLGGELRLTRRHPSGTLLQWRVPSSAE